MDIFGEDQHHLVRIDRETQEHILHVQIKILNLTKHFEEKLTSLEQRIISYRAENNPKEIENLRNFMSTDISNIWNHIRSISNNIKHLENLPAKLSALETTFHSSILSNEGKILDLSEKYDKLSSETQKIFKDFSASINKKLEEPLLQAFKTDVIKKHKEIDETLSKLNGLLNVQNKENFEKNLQEFKKQNESSLKKIENNNNTSLDNFKEEMKRKNKDLEVPLKKLQEFNVKLESKSSEIESKLKNLNEKLDNKVLDIIKSLEDVKASNVLRGKQIERLNRQLFDHNRSKRSKKTLD